VLVHADEYVPEIREHLQFVISRRDAALDHREHQLSVDDRIHLLVTSMMVPVSGQ
jgi:hypothetical protein